MLEVFDRLKTLQDVLAEKYELQAKIGQTKSWIESVQANR